MTTDNSYFDTGLVNIQNDYLNSISGNVVLTETQTSKIGNVQTLLADVNDTLNGSNTNSLYSQQKNMITILDNEQQRLNLKKNKIETAIDGKQRILDLNESYRARNADYIYLLAIFVLGLFILLCISQLMKMFQLSSEMGDLIYVIILSITLIYMYSKYVKISGRDKLYYDKLNLKPPKILSAEEIKAQIERNQDNAQYSSVSDLMGTINVAGCVGPLCCSGDTIWDADNSVCVKKTSGFTTLENIDEIIQPNSPNEFIHYSIYK